MRIGVRHQLVGLLGGAIEAQRMVDIVGGSERHAGIATVDRGRRRVEEMPASGMPATFQHVEEAADIGVRVGVRVDQRMAHAGLGGEIHHIGKAVGREQAPPSPRGRQGRSSRTGSWETPELRQPRLFEPRIVIRVEVVEADHVVPIRQQAAGDMHADEPGRSGDENHVRQDSPFFRLRRRSAQATPYAAPTPHVCARPIRGSCSIHPKMPSDPLQALAMILALPPSDRRPRPSEAA